MDGDQITEFSEKPQTKEGWINGAFFVLEPEIFDYIEGDMNALREGTAGATGAGRPVDGVPSFLVLAVHGYGSGKEVTGNDVGERKRTLENLGGYA